MRIVRSAVLALIAILGLLTGIASTARADDSGAPSPTPSAADFPGDTGDPGGP